MPLVTQLTPEQLRDLPMMAPAMPKSGSVGAVDVESLPVLESESDSSVLPERGRTLRDEMNCRLERDQRFTIDEIRRFARQLCDVVQADPSKAGRVRAEMVCLLDDGSIRLMGGLVAPKKLRESRAFEFVRRRALKVDDGQQGIAILLFELLTGCVPGEPMPPHELRKNVPQHLSLAILRALSPDPHQRFPNLSEFRQQLTEPTPEWQQRLNELLCAVGLRNRQATVSTASRGLDEKDQQRRDAAIGINLRWRDNSFQAITILVCLVGGALVGAVTEINTDWLTGAGAGGFLGFLFGLIVSTLVVSFQRSCSQTLVVLLCCSHGALIGYLLNTTYDPTEWTILGGLLGFIVGVIGCGFVRMVSHGIKILRGT